MKLIIVHGASCSGKSTYVREHMEDADICYDYDRLVQATTNRTKHTEDVAPSYKLINGLRYSMLKNFKDYKETKGNLYFITTYLTTNFEEFANEEDIEYHYMDVTREECLERLKKDDSRENKDFWKDKINEYFDKKEKEEQKANEQRMKLKIKLKTF